MRRMRHLLLSLLVVSAVMPLAPASVSVALAAPALTGTASATRIIVEPASAGDGFTLQSRLKRDGARVIDRSLTGNALLVEVPAGRGSREYADALASVVDLTIAEPLHTVTASEVPTDPSYSLQWGLPAIGAPVAWDRGWGSSSVVIAVVDSGVDLDHPDLVDQIVQGWDFIDGDAVPDDAQIHSHGTHVAGIAAAEANNGVVGSGTAPGCVIMPVRVLDANGNGTDWGTANGIVWAVDHGADVINLSLGTPGPSTYLSAAVAYAVDNDVVVVAASGNCDPARLVDVQYPAREPGVIAVGAVQKSGPYAVASFSQDGPGLDLTAPGVNIYSTVIGGAGYMSGTSMATPFVSGTVALMKSLDPTLTPAEVTSILGATAQDLGPAGRDDTYGFGLVRADAAVYAIDLAPSTAISTDVAPGGSGWYRTAPNITLTPDVPSVTYYRWDGGAPQVYATPIVAAEGVHTLTYWSEAGTLVESPKDAVFEVDTQAPSVASITSALARGTISADITWSATTDGGSGVAGYVVRTSPGGTVLATTTSTSALVAGLAPGTAYTLEVVASDVAGNSASSAPVVVSTVPALALQPVYRFYNAGSGTHFFTPSTGERDMVIATWPTLYAYEGVAYYTYPANNTQPLYRFYNRVSRSHFYTASPSEANTVSATLSGTFTYDGETYRVSTAPAADRIPVYRFYNVRNGSHFYTASATERDNVRASLAGVYTYEGAGFWLGQ